MFRSEYEFFLGVFCLKKVRIQYFLFAEEVISSFPGNLIPKRKLIKLLENEIITSHYLY